MSDIEIQVNGQAQRVQAGLSLEAVLAKLSLPSGRVAVERNKEVVPRTRYAATLVEDGDRLEVVTLVGGG